jgi:hypothetical protein
LKKITKRWTLLDEYEEPVNITLLEFGHSAECNPAATELQVPENASYDPSTGRLTLKSSDDDDEIEVRYDASSGNVYVALLGDSLEDDEGGAANPGWPNVQEVYFDGGRGNDRVTLDSPFRLRRPGQRSG